MEMITMTVMELPFFTCKFHYAQCNIIAIPEGFEFSAAFQSVVLSTVPSSRRVMHPTARLSRRSYSQLQNIAVA